MKVKVFEVSVDEKRSATDEKKLNEFISTVKVKKTSVQFINGAFNCWSVMVFYESEVQQAQEAEKEGRSELTSRDKKIAEKSEKSELTEEQELLYTKLKQWRQKKASEASIPVYLICRNNEIEQLVLTRPANLSDLEKIKGFGAQKINKFGKEILKILK